MDVGGWALAGKPPVVLGYDPPLSHLRREVAPRGLKPAARKS